LQGKGGVAGELPHILVVDDEERIRSMLVRYFEGEGFRVSLAQDGASMRERMAADPADVVFLDVVLPGEDGLILARELRATSDVGIIMLTGRGDVVDRVVGIEVGADDYIAKPFHFAELLARVRAHLRRHPSGEARHDAATLQFGDLSLDPRTRHVQRGDHPIELTAREFELLELFLRNPRMVLSKDSILDRLWGYAFDDNLVEVYVGYLRRKLGEPPLIETLRGAGYALRARS
jgi:two-component system, OmpR family, response regulator MprA